MARARNIKPGFYKNYKLADLGPVAQLLFAGLWGLADREGRLEDKPRLIKAEIFPYYDCDVNGELTKLEREGFVARYVVDGVAVVQVANFKKHQTPHNTEKASTLPAQPAANPHEHSGSENNRCVTVEPRKSNDGKTPDSLIHRFTDSLIPDTGLLKAEAEAPPLADDGRDQKSVPLPTREEPPMSNDPAVQMTVMLRRLGVTALFTHPDIQSWSSRQIATEILEQAVRVARERKGDAPIPVAYLRPIVEQLLNPPTARASPPGVAGRLGKAGQATAQAAEQWLSEQEHE